MALFSGLGHPCAAQAQGEPGAAAPREPAAAGPAPAAAVPAGLAPTPSPEVPTVVAAVAAGGGRSAGLGDRITVTVTHLDTLLHQVGGNCQQIVLFLGGLPLSQIRAQRCDPDDGHVGFYLQRSGDDKWAWHALLGRPTGFSRPVQVTVGPSDDRSLPTQVLDFQLIVLPRLGFYLFLALLVVLVPLALQLARRSDILRNPAVQPLPGGRRPYSLAQFQLAFWSLLAVAAYIFLWMVTGELDTITESVLALIGIGSGTALGAVLIDTGKQQAPAARSAGFLTDVLNDDDGVSLHRFQLFVWTLILGIIFCASVYRTLTMPQFSPTLLGLMGISSGTYLGFKFPEKSPAPATAPATTTGAAPAPAAPAPPTETGTPR